MKYYYIINLIEYSLAVSEPFILEKHTLTELLDHVMIYLVSDSKTLVKFSSECFNKNKSSKNHDKYVNFLRLTLLIQLCVY